MRFFIIAAAVALALSQVASDAAAHGTPSADPSPAGPLGTQVTTINQNPTPKPASLNGSSGGSPASGPSPDSEATPGSLADVSAAAAQPGGPVDVPGSPKGSVPGAPASPPTLPTPVPGGAPGNGQTSPAGKGPAANPAALIPGDMSSGKCMCPPPPSCGAGPPPPPPADNNGTATPVPSPSGNLSDATSQNAISPPPAGGTNNGEATSPAVNIFRQARSLTGLVAVGIVAIMS